MKSIEANNLQELLNSSIDPSSESFWANLKHCIITSKEILSLNRRSILNLKLIFAEIPNNLQNISTISHLLKLLKPSLKSDVGGEIGITINTILFEKKNISANDISSFLNSSSFICSGNPKMKRAVLDEIIEPFSENLSLDNLLEFPPLILSSLFELMISLISQCPENRSLLSQYLNEVHLSKCLKLIKQCNDSLAQMLISEWLWRAINGLPTKPNFKKIFGKLSDTFQNISMENFRESLHLFIMAINQKSNMSIIHIEFDEIIYNNVELSISGWIDLNPNSIAIWLINQSTPKGSNNNNFPDVVVLRLSMIYNTNISQKQIMFNTKEKLQTFNSISKEKPCKFEFLLNRKIDKTVLEEFNRRIQKKYTNEIKNISKQKVGKLSTLSKEPNLIPDKKRIYAKNPNAKRKNTPTEHKIYSDDEIRELTDDDMNDDDLMFGKTTQEKDDNIHKIEEILNNFQKFSIESINQTESSAQLEINSIVSKLEDNMRMLNQLSQQHKDLTEITTKESKTIGENVSNLEKEFQVKNEEMVQKRNLISAQVNKEIESEKMKFVEETNDAFENNAIVGLTTHLSNLREIMCSIPV